MTKEQEALKLAQKALSNKNAPAKTIYEALAAIQKALAQPEQDGKCKYCTDGCPACDARKLPEQEPVAFASHGVVNWIADKQFQHEASLYTTPPQRTWVGLTRTELIRCGVLPFGLSYELYEAIEAKLKEKNEQVKDT